MAVDPDIVTGYNIQNFDLPYIIDRAQVLGMDGYATFTRVKGVLSTVRDMTLQCK